MPWGIAKAVLGVGGAIGGGIIGSDAAKSAESAQNFRQQQAIDWIQQNYNQTQGNLQPYATAGQSALGSLLGFYGLPGGNSSGATQSFQQFQGTPFYQFPLQQANLATNRSLAASGLTSSGGALRDLSQLNAGYASSGLSQYLSGLGGIAGAGQSAGQQLGQIGLNTGGQIAQRYTNIGNASAQGIYNSAAAWNQAIQGSIGAITGGGGQSGGMYGQSSYGGGNSGGGGSSGMGSIMNLFGGGGGGGGISSMGEMY